MPRSLKVGPAEMTGFLDRGTTVTGELRFSGTMRIDGEFHGSISTEDILTIGEYAQIHADIRAGRVEIHGKVSGNIEAARRIEIRSTGRVSGDLRTPVLVIEDGGTLEGQSRMSESAEEADGASPAQPNFKGVDEVN
jgi:cytoskeletal protein CcmA (bactofilin family)